MIIYFVVILFCFLLSTVKVPRKIENIAIALIALFLCFGYMTGSDWYNYELFYENAKLYKNLVFSAESGYVFLQNLIVNLGVDFWFFHIFIKLLVFYTLVSFVRSLNVNIFLFLAFFIPEIGFYLFIDCPFRTLIAFGFALIAYRKLLENKTLSYFIYVAIALSFHLSSAILIIFYFVYKKNIKTTVVLIIAFVVYIIAYNTDFLISKVYIPLTEISPLISERLKGYFLSSRFISDKISIGTFIRFAVLFVLLLYKEIIISGDDKRKYIYNLSILFLLIHPFGLTMKIFNRLSLYLVPFYIISIIYMLKSFSIKMNKYILYLFFLLIFLKQTYSLVTYDYKYVPYSNYLYHWVKKDLPDIEYRKQYNPTHTPYKRKIPLK